MIRCTRCSRANPLGAAFCFFDGTSIASGAALHADPARRPFPAPFVFPGGKRCATFDELVLACCDDWKAAKELLQEGAFADFLARLGRADLSRAARMAQNDADADGALDGFIRQLPSTLLEPPRLVAKPDRISLGELRPGQGVTLELRLENAGMGLLSGSISSAEPWLLLGKPDAPSPRKVFQFLGEKVIPFHIAGKSLRASPRPVEGRLVLDTSGGRVEVPVSYSVPVKPYPDGPFAGAITPRQVAEKSLSKPAEAGGHFASGAVARWYDANGWDYPVREPAPTGVAAVQQFFEALGLSKPPQVRISRTEIDLSSPIGQRVLGSVELLSDEKKPIWASVACDADWLDLREIELAKKPATVRLGASRVAGRAGEHLTARVTITTNGRVRHVVTVRLAVQAGSQAPPSPPLSPPVSIQSFPPPPPVPQPSLPASVPPVLAAAVALPAHDSLPVAPSPPPPPPPPRGKAPPLPPVPPAPASQGKTARKVMAWLPVGILAVGLLIPIVRDISAYATGNPSGGGPSAPFVPEDLSKYPDALVIGFDDQDRDITLAPGGTLKPGGGGPLVGSFPGVQPATMRFGLTLIKGGSKLNFFANGATNNTVIQIDGTSRYFGDSGWKAKPPRTDALGLPGRWIERDRSATSKSLRQARSSTWECGTEGIQVTQTVGLVPGSQSSAFDTCRVTYRLVNRGNISHSVGLRFLLDTYIGSNDGVPFLIPGQTRLVSDTAEFNRADDIPDFIQACEREDLANPGTVARLGLRLPGAEPPSRLTLGAYPNPLLNARFPLMGGRFRQMMTAWDVPVVSIKSLPENDSAVTIYWEARPLRPGQSREMAFTYGLGSLSSSKGELALTVGGSFFVGGEFTLTAYVKDPSRGERLSLVLPAGFSLVSGKADEPVPPLPGDRSTRISPVTWKIRAGSEGSHTLKVKASSGAEQSQPLRIKAKGIFGG